MRPNPQTATIENGLFYLARQAPWLTEYLHELTTFPNAKYSDQADSTSQALAWITVSVANQAELHIYAKFTDKNSERLSRDQLGKATVP